MLALIHRLVISMNTKFLTLEHTKFVLRFYDVSIISIRYTFVFIRLVLNGKLWKDLSRFGRTGISDIYWLKLTSVPSFACTPGVMVYLPNNSQYWKASVNTLNLHRCDDTDKVWRQNIIHWLTPFWLKHHYL